MKTVWIILISILLLSGCVKDRDDSDLPKPKFKSGQVVYDKLTSKKAIIIDYYVAHDNGVRYTVRLENMNETTFREFEISSEQPIKEQQPGAAYEIGY